MVNTIKNIIIIGPAHPLRPGGITTFNERLCKAFLQEGYQCSIISYSLQYPSFLFPGQSQFTTDPAPEGITIHSMINSVNPFNWIKVGMYLRKQQPDLIICRFWIPFLAPALGTLLRVAGGKNRNITVLADNIVPHEKRPGDGIFTEYLMPPVSRFVVMSKKVMHDLRKFTLKPAQLVPHPLYDNFGEKVDKNNARQYLQQHYACEIQPEDKILLFFGLVRDYKGLDLLLQAMPTLETKKCKLIVAGEWYIDAQVYDEWLLKPTIANCVTVLNRFIPNHDVKYFFCAADCVVQPYRSATQSGVTPVAYHFDVPMIVTNVGGLPELVPHTKAGIVCEPEPYALGRAIDIFFEIGAVSFASGIQTIKQKLSWKALVEVLINFTAVKNSDI